MYQVLRVIHYGQPKMVGKIIHVDGRFVFYHRQSGTQPHRKTRSPGGVDVAVLEWLEEHGIAVILHEHEGSVFLTTVEDVRSGGVAASWDNRERLFLPWSDWVDVGERWFEVPWIDTQTIIT